MKPTKTPLTDGVITVSIRNRISSDGKTIRQKRFIRAARNPTTPSPKPTDPPTAPPAAPPAPPAPPPPAAAGAATPPEAFTAAQDAQLLELKSKNTSWKQISILMDGKAQWALRERFKELNAKAGAEETKGESKTAEEKKKEEEAEKKKAAAEEKKRVGEERKRAWEEGKKKAGEEAEKAKEAGGGEAAKASEAKGQAKIVFVNDGRFSLDEAGEDQIVLVHKLAERHDNRKWLEIASKFFDTTGKRVHPDELREALSGGGT